VDLRRLSEHFAKIQLVDLDTEALRSGVATQGLVRSKRIEIAGGVDLSGIGDFLSTWGAERSPDDAELERCLVRARDARPLPDSPLQDTVISACLLSQIVESITMAVGEGYPRVMDLISVVRRRHLQLMLDLLGPGGQGLLVTDFVSSDTCRELETVEDARLGALSTELIHRQNFFTGLNPFVLLKLLAEDPVFQRQITGVQLTKPWRWHFPARTYAVCTLVFTKAGECRANDRPG